jgi:hypothetical protein
VKRQAIGLYDQDGVLRYAGGDRDDCLAYAELFALAPDTYSLIDLLHPAHRDGAESRRVA